MHFAALPLPPLLLLLLVLLPMRGEDDEVVARSSPGDSRGGCWSCERGGGVVVRTMRANRGVNQATNRHVFFTRISITAVVVVVLLNLISLSGTDRGEGDVFRCCFQTALLRLWEKLNERSALWEGFPTGCMNARLFLVIFFLGGVGVISTAGWHAQALKKKCRIF